MQNAPASTATFPAWIFVAPSPVIDKGFSFAVFGQDPESKTWLYWDAAAASYSSFSGPDGYTIAPLIPVPASGSYSLALPAQQAIQSGVVVMFIGSSQGIPVKNGAPGTPTAGTNPNDIFSLFEFTYLTAGTSGATLDVDISNVDQVGFTYTADSSGSAPFPLSSVGSTLARQTLLTRFAAAFPSGSPFNECLVYGQGADGTQLRLLAPQDVLQSISPPPPPGYLAPGGQPIPNDTFATGASYFYCASESSATGETVPNALGVFGGFLLGPDGAVTASQISIGWLSGSSVGAYHPQNPSATSINLYRATVPPAQAGSTIPQPPPSDQFKLLTSQTIADWNAQPGDVYIDRSTSIAAQTPQVSSYGFSALSTWFDTPLRDFFAYYQTTPFSLYQSNQYGTGSNGTLWTGTVQWVWPDKGQHITSQTYVDDKGNAQPVGAQWQWGDGTQGYLVLQLVGNAYNPDNYSDTALAGANGLCAAEYQGAVVNIYFPYFLDNTGLGSVNLPASLTTIPTSNYSLSKAPGWMANASNGPSQMVFGCSGVFATPNDPDAQGQNMAGLTAQALTNLQNVIVSGFNRGVATGYGFALGPQQYTGSYSLSQPLQSQPATGAVPPGTYTYYLSGVLNDGAETALSWGQTITLAAAAAVTLTWLPQPPALYKQANIYRQQGSGTIQLVGAVSNTGTAPATGFIDQNTPGTPPAHSGPYPFYPLWNNQTASGYVPSNLYSAFLHQNASADPTNGISINGLVYGYPFDDQGDFSTNINYGTSLPSTITFTISPLS